MNSGAELLNRFLKTASCPVIAIDGRSAAGKTTAALRLAEEYGLSVVHMDDFFLPFDMRTAGRLAQPGGNVHYERFAEEVLPFLRREFSYRRFDCSSGSFGEPVRTDAGGVIVEGAYSLHPAFGRYYDLAVFMDITPELQRRRIIERGGMDKWEQFRTRWIPLEEKYHTANRTADKCSVVISAE